MRQSGRRSDQRLAIPSGWRRSTLEFTCTIGESRWRMSWAEHELQCATTSCPLSHRRQSAIRSAKREGPRHGDEQTKRPSRAETRAEGGVPARNGSSGKASSGNGSPGDTIPATKADLETSLPLIDTLVAREPPHRGPDRQGTGERSPDESDLGDAFVSLGFIDEHKLVEPRADLYGMAIADLRQGEPDPEALALIPDSMAREHFVIPVDVDESGISVAMANPPTPELTSLLDHTTQTTVIPMLAPLSEIRIAIDNNYRAIGGLDHLVQAFEAVEETRRRPRWRDRDAHRGGAG